MTIRESFEFYYMPISDFIDLLEKGGDIYVPRRFKKVALIFAENSIRNPRGGQFDVFLPPKFNLIFK